MASRRLVLASWWMVAAALSACGGGRTAAPEVARPAARQPAAHLLPESTCAGADACRRACESHQHATACRRAAELVDEPVLAAALLERGCELRDGRACVRLGRMYDDEGTGVEHDSGRAFQLYDLACDDRSGEGCELAGWCLHLGDGVVEDRETAARYHARAAKAYEAACEAGSTDDCAFLGEMHRTGLAVREDAVRAGTLFARACKGGSDTGCRAHAEHGDGRESCDRTERLTTGPRPMKKVLE